MASEIKVDTIVNAGGDNDSGIDLSTNDVVVIKTANTERVKVDASGVVTVDRVINATTSADPWLKGVNSSGTETFFVKPDGTLHASGNVGIGTTAPNATGLAIVTGGGAKGVMLTRVASGGSNPTSGQGLGSFGFKGIMDGSNTLAAAEAAIEAIASENHSGSTAGTHLAFYTKASGTGPGSSPLERLRLLDNGVFLVAKTADNNTDAGVVLSNGGNAFVRASGGVASFNRTSDDGLLVSLQQAGTTEGDIVVSGSTVSYNGFSGLHESSGIPTDTPIGTVVSTIDELDVYSTKQEGLRGEEDNPKAGQTRADHAKVKVSDTVGDSAVYGVVGRFNEQDKVFVASVGIGSVRVTGACAKGDLLESNGDGTAKVQSDDIVRSKTIGKVTIGNSNTGVKLVSCVLYCG
jgi:hypothetical protein